MDRFRIAISRDKESLNDRILFKHGTVPAIYFPSGQPKDGGTCHFTTPRCVKWCTNSTANEKEKEIHNFFMTEKLNNIFAKVYSEVQKDGSNMLYWFAAGDCPPKKSKRILNIMKQFSTAGIIQMGFTRNQELWEGARKMENNYLVLTVENMKKAEKLSDKGVIAVPNYNTGIVNLYLNRRHYGGCGADWFEFEETFCENDCQGCYAEGEGCFSEIG